MKHIEIGNHCNKPIIFTSDEMHIAFNGDIAIKGINYYLIDLSLEDIRKLISFYSEILENKKGE